jgi:hypothetical protein
MIEALFDIVDLHHYQHLSSLPLPIDVHMFGMTNRLWFLKQGTNQAFHEQFLILSTSSPLGYAWFCDFW